MGQCVNTTDQILEANIYELKYS